MIRNSFRFLDSIGIKGEQNLHKQGIPTWDAFLKQERIKGISAKRKAYYDRRLKEAKKALTQKDSAYFKKELPQSLIWLLYQHFKADALYLDIEIDQTGSIIIVGLYDGFETKTLVRGINLTHSLLQSELDNYPLLVTFNGSAFDLPKLRKQLNISFQALHLDLKHLCDKLGLSGGLKEVEKQLNLERPQHLRGNPVDLWKAFHASGDREYLDLLIAYNEEDVINLKPLAQYCYKRLSSQKLFID